ncbi:hypothetical protein [Frankia sp. Cr2]|nr:hypothetical protein [Frankia sp. Cr2]
MGAHEAGPGRVGRRLCGRTLAHLHADAGTADAEQEGQAMAGRLSGSTCG